MYAFHCSLVVSRHAVISIDWAHFTPWTSLVGGVAMGLTAAMLVLLNGRIAGMHLYELMGRWKRPGTRNGS
jgi:uncharacterized membrane protein YedE/YeeE